MDDDANIDVEEDYDDDEEEDEVDEVDEEIGNVVGNSALISSRDWRIEDCVNSVIARSSPALGEEFHRFSPDIARLIFCELCGEQFESEQRLTHHIGQSHSCPDCDRLFDSLKGKSAHRKYCKERKRKLEMGEEFLAPQPPRPKKMKRAVPEIVQNSSVIQYSEAQPRIFRISPAPANVSGPGPGPASCSMMVNDSYHHSGMMAASGHVMLPLFTSTASVTNGASTDGGGNQLLYDSETPSTMIFPCPYLCGAVMHTGAAVKEHMRLKHSRPVPLTNPHHHHQNGHNHNNNSGLHPPTPTGAAPLVLLASAKADMST